jgi:hypothetical protein
VPGRSVRVHPDAVRDIEDGITFYLSRSQVAAERFLTENRNTGVGAGSEDAHPRTLHSCATRKEPGARGASAQHAIGRQ